MNISDKSFFLSSSVFNPWGQCFPRAPISILVIHIPAHRAYIPYAGLVIVFYMTDYNRLSNLMCILNCSICKRSPVMIFFPPLPSATNTPGVFMNVASSLISVLERTDFHLR